MTPVLPFWFKQRQGKIKPAGPETIGVTGPNLGETYLGIRRTATGRWQGTLKVTADGPEAAVSELDFETVPEAWEAAFEIYRQRVVV